ncbi:DUF6111 family protein [Methyloligella sp. 2.7D]|uniref:DUF6111 family protein n=1 Tax=unclassified Methyloligella TaxID=2625955 RepID=UPI00157C5626|nr:DUF6111 family protein [Methyloligella sp. GL2]QKP77006.1 hypothetical protein HT051_05790 [Methyloligella sp. GL2]
MLRIVLIDLLLLILPFLVYAAYVVLVKGTEPANVWQDAPVTWLIGASVLLLAIAMVTLVSFQGGDPSAVYHPPVYEDGVIKPGYVE